MVCGKEVTWFGVSKLLVCVDTIVEVSTVGLGSAIVGRTNGKCVETL